MGLDKGVTVLLVGMAVFRGLGQVVTEGKGLFFLLFVELQLGSGLGHYFVDIIDLSVRHA